MKKNLIGKIISLAATTALAGSLLAGCGNTAQGEIAPTPSEEISEQSVEITAADAGEEVEFKGTITVAASQTPHSEILAEAAKILKEQGWDLQVTVFDDYVQPNNVVEAEEFDANYFQHIPYLNSFNEEQGTHLVNAGGIHYEPFGIYAGTKDSLDDIADGDEIAIPNDTTNEARALLLLQDNGLIKLKDGAGLTATVNDIEENEHNIEFVELEAAQVARVVSEVEYVILNGNYALEAGYSVGRDSIAYEASDSVAAQTYVNIIGVLEGNENTDKIKALVTVLRSVDIKKFIEDTYDGAVIFFEEQLFYIYFKGEVALASPFFGFIEHDYMETCI